MGRTSEPVHTSSARLRELANSLQILCPSGCELSTKITCSSIQRWLHLRVLAAANDLLLGAKSAYDQCNFMKNTSLNLIHSSLKLQSIDHHVYETLLYHFTTVFTEMCSSFKELFIFVRFGQSTICGL